MSSNYGKRSILLTTWELTGENRHDRPRRQSQNIENRKANLKRNSILLRNRRFVFHETAPPVLVEAMQHEFGKLLENVRE